MGPTTTTKIQREVFCYDMLPAKSLQLCPTLCDPMDHSPPGSSVHGILQARILQWVAMPSSRGSSNPGIKPSYLLSPALAGWFFTTSATWEAHTFTYIKVQFSRSVMSDSLRPHGLQHARLLCPSASPRACSNSCPSSW